jgi:hypothetical protein
MNKCLEIGGWKNTTLNGRVLYPLSENLGGKILGAGEIRERKYFKTGSFRGSILAWRKSEPQIVF